MAREPTATQQDEWKFPTGKRVYRQQPNIFGEDKQEALILKRLRDETDGGRWYQVLEGEDAELYGALSFEAKYEVQ